MESIEAVMTASISEMGELRVYLGSVVSQQLAPRTSYDRYYEGRKTFGSITAQVCMHACG